jgi:hypothetical protein
LGGADGSSEGAGAGRDVLDGGGRGGAAPGARLGNCLAVLMALFALVFDADAPIVFPWLQLVCIRVEVKAHADMVVHVHRI